MNKPVNQCNSGFVLSPETQKNGLESMFHQFGRRAANCDSPSIMNNGHCNTSIYL